MRRTTNGMERRTHGGYRGELKGSGRKGRPLQVTWDRAVSVGSVVKPHTKPEPPRESWWLDAANFYALAKSRDWGRLGHVNINTFAVGENDLRSHGVAKQWTPPAERGRRELPA